MTQETTMSDDPTRPYAGKLCKVCAGAGGDGGVRHSPGEPPDPPWCCEACNGTGEDPDSEAGLLRARVAELEAEREWYRQALTGATGQDLAHFTECMATAGPFCPPVNLRVGGIHRARFDAEAERDHQASLRERAAVRLDKMANANKHAGQMIAAGAYRIAASIVRDPVAARTRPRPLGDSDAT